MNTSITYHPVVPGADHLLHDLDYLDQMIEVLTRRREMVWQQLDVTTHPAHPATAEAAAQPLRRGYVYQGVIRRLPVATACAIDIYLEILKRLWTDFPGCREAMASAMAARGRVRRYVGRSPGELFSNKNEAWVEAHSCELVPGWFVDINLRYTDKRKLLEIAVVTAGLVWGTDVRVVW